MKVWMYYADPSDIFVNTDDVVELKKAYNDRTQILYALTNNKRDARMFRATRNMYIFTENVIDLTDEEWEILIKDNRDCVLEWHKVITRKTCNDISHYGEVSILLTFMESIDIDDNATTENIILSEFSGDASPVSILNNYMLKELFKLYYWDILSIILDAECDIPTDLCPCTAMDDAILNMAHNYRHREWAHVDQLEYFIRHYGHTLANW